MTTHKHPMVSNIENPAEVMRIVRKYPDFVLDQSNNISYDIVCFAAHNVSRSNSIFEINKYINNMHISVDIEMGIFEYSLLYCTINNLVKRLISSVYNRKIDDIVKNFEINPELITNVKANIIKPRMMALMSPAQLCPEKWDGLLAKLRAKEEKENNLPTTNIYRCRKCEQRKCTVSLLQTRSIDEPMTIFVTCCICHNTWTV